MHDLAKFLPISLKNGDILDQEYLSVCNKEFTEDEIRSSKRENLPISLKDGVEDKDKKY